MRDDMHFLSSEQVRAIADQRSPHTVAASEVVWSGRIVDMVEDRVVVVEGEEPVVRQYTRHPGAGSRACLWRAVARRRAHSEQARSQYARGVMP